MRVLVYGMQSSGASLCTFLLGQAPRTVSIVDLWNDSLMPALEDVREQNVVAKCVLTTRYDFEDHRENFGADKTILWLRHPYHNYVALHRKSYADDGGSVDAKFAKLEAVFRERDRFDATLLYEDFVARPETTLASLRACGLEVQKSFYEFPRAKEDIAAYNMEHSRWCREHFGSSWGFGNIRRGNLRPGKLFKYVSTETKAHVCELCPEVCRFFDDYYARHVSTLNLATMVLWHDVIARQAKRLQQRLWRLSHHGF